MKKTVIINISGIIFHIDEDAFERLSRYLDALKRYFGSGNEGQEVIADIEARIAELLQPKITGNKQSITIEDIEEIIAILGRAEDIAGAGAENGTGSSSYEKGSRKLYRDPDNSIIGGVCSGLGAYFNIDPVIFRIIFIALLFAGGLSIWVYIIMWIAVPSAVTTAQKLEMRGENVNISNLERKIREECNDISSSFKKHNVEEKVNSGIREVFQAIGRVFLFILTFLKYIVGALFIIVSISFIIALVSGFYFSNLSIDEPFFSTFHSVRELFNSVIDPFTTNLLLLLSTILIVLPCAALIYWGLKIIINFKASDKIVSVVLSVVWIVVFITMFAVVFNQVNKFRYEGMLKDTVSLKAPSGKVVYFRATGESSFLDNYHDYESGIFGIDRSGNKDQIVSPVRIYIERSKDSTLRAEIVKKGRGISDEDASDLLKSIRVNLRQEDTLIYIEPVFRLPEGERWKFNRVKLYIYLPGNLTYNLDPKIQPFVHDYRNDGWRDEIEIHFNGDESGLERKLRSVEISE